MIFPKLQEFRKSIYEHLGTAKDAVFELMDAVLTSPSVSSYVSLSMNPLFRRKWSSIYEGLCDSRPARGKLMKLIVQEISTEEQPLLAGDSSVWLRPDAETLKDKGFHHGKDESIGVGQSYSTLAWIPETSGSWALPIKHERITSFETPVSRAAFQLKQVTEQLRVRPLAVYDRGYGNASFVKATAKIESDLLLRLASNRCVWGVPPAYSGRGAPCKHGHKFKLNAPETWSEPTSTIEITDPKLGRVRVTHWRGFHFRASPERPMEIFRVEVIEPLGRNRKFQPMWLAWLGETMPNVETLWLKYLRRFALEHWYRFAKQRLHWTLPQFTSAHSAERWSALMPLITWQLWFARQGCVDSPLPWQSPQDHLAAGRVAQTFAVIIAAIGSPAIPPKLRGKSSGRSKGDRFTPRIRYPSVKKHASKRKKTEKTPVQIPPIAI